MHIDKDINITLKSLKWTKKQSKQDSSHAAIYIKAF